MSLPTWQDTEGWARRDSAVLKVMKTGYPRFFIHRSIVSLGEGLIRKHQAALFGAQSIDSIGTVLFYCEKHAVHCEQYLLSKASEFEHLVVRRICFASGKSTKRHDREIIWDRTELHVVVYSQDLFNHAKDFWQHTGFGISSRYAESCLSSYDELVPQGNIESTANASPNPKNVGKVPNLACKGCNAKQDLRMRIAKLASCFEQQVNADDVFIFPTGMSAISQIAEILKTLAGSGQRLKVVAYG